MYRINRIIGSQIFGKLVGNRYWHYFDLARSCSCYTRSRAMKLLWHYLKFGGWAKNRLTANLKSSTNKLCTVLCP